MHCFLHLSFKRIIFQIKRPVNYTTTVCQGSGPILNDRIQARPPADRARHCWDTLERLHCNGAPWSRTTQHKTQKNIGFWSCDSYEQPVGKKGIAMDMSRGIRKMRRRTDSCIHTVQKRKQPRLKLLSTQPIVVFEFCHLSYIPTLHYVSNSLLLKTGYRTFVVASTLTSCASADALVRVIT